MYKLLMDIEPVEIAKHDHFMSWAQVRSIRGSVAPSNLEFKDMETIVKRVSSDIDNGWVAGLHNKKATIGFQVQSEQYRFLSSLTGDGAAFVLGEFNIKAGGNRYLSGAVKHSSNKEDNYAFANVGLRKELKGFHFHTGAAVGFFGKQAKPEIAVSGNIKTNKFYLHGNETTLFAGIKAHYNAEAINMSTKIGSTYLIHQTPYTFSDKINIIAKATMRIGLECEGEPSNPFKDCEPYAKLGFNLSQPKPPKPIFSSQTF